MLVYAVAIGIMTLSHFFFQAEDGIRDYKVTGVQTCALPICSCRRSSASRSTTSRSDIVSKQTVSILLPYHALSMLPADAPAPLSPPISLQAARFRSEERRVGKESRSRWWGDPRAEQHQVRGS